MIRLVEGWLIEREDYQIKPVHPLVAAQELHLEEGGVQGGPKQTRVSGGSRPPIRDMRGVNPRVDRVMSTVRSVNNHWYNTLIAYAETGKVNSRHKLDSGVACFLGAWNA